MSAVLSTPKCLDEEELLEFVAGRSGGEAQRRVEQHLGECDECSALAGEVASNGGAEPADVNASETSVPALLTGGQQVGRYIIRELIGAGGMGAVYRARDPSLDREVALKLLRPRASASDLRARLLREAKAMAKLSHPEIIAVFDVGTHDDQLFIAMELIRGGTLRTWQRAPARDWREVLAVYLRAGRGLAQAHAMGIVHRDFKPDNVLVGDDGRVRVTDFGLARIVDDADRTLDAPTDDLDAPLAEPNVTKTGMFIGTPAYMAPEQLGGQPADVRSDIFSFCAALYEGLYGARPFAGATLHELQRAKRAGEIAAPPRDARDVPEQLRQALLVGLRPLPRDRYASMEELLAALERASRATPHSRRRWVAAGLVVAAFGAAAALAVPALRAQRTRVAASSASAAAPLAGECASARACVEAHHGEAWICRADHTCAKLASDDCTPLFEPDDLAEGTVWLGTMFPTKDQPEDAMGTQAMRAADFARAELRAATVAATSTTSGRIRRVALVACDDSVDAMRAAKHLVDDVRVPAILGFASSKETMDLANELLVPRGVLTLATITNNPLVTRVAQPAGPRLVWRTTYSNAALADGTARIVSALESTATAKNRATRVVLAHSDDAPSTAIAEPFFRNLTFNGKSAMENGSAYVELSFHPGTAETRSDVARKIVAARASFVALATSRDEAVELVERIEASWPEAANRPTYVVLGNSTKPFVSFLGKNADRRHRFFAVQSRSNSMPNARFVIRYNQAHPNAPIDRMINAGSIYDGFYLAAYAAFANGEAEPNGPSLARAFERLVPPGETVEVGPTAALDAIAALSRGGRIDLQGTATALDYDLTTGEAPADFVLVCAAIDANSAATGEDIEPGMVFHASSRTVDGSRSCP